MPGVCSRCLREVFFAEEKLALGKVWHTFCFSCRNCRKLLDSWTVATHSGELYCRNCHNRLFPTTSVRAALPFFVRATLPSVDNEDPAVSPCESLSDCRCCCYCSDDYAIINPREDEEQPVGSSDSPLGEKKRLRGGGGADGEDEELEKNSVQGTGGIDKSDCDIGDSQLDAQSFVTTLCDPPQGPTAVTAWYNRHHSASQSTFSRPSSALRQLNRPSSTPASAENGINRDAKGCRCARHRGPISPCRTNHKNRRHSESCHRHFRSEFHRPDKIVEPRERGKFVKDFAGGNFVENYRNHLSFENSDISDVPLTTSPSEYRDDVADPEVDEDPAEDCRMRGGCGGGGSGCCCSSGPSRTNVTFDRRTSSPCGKRRQGDRGSTVDGACGCGGQGRTGCGSTAGGCCSDGKNVAGSGTKTGGCCGGATNEGACASKPGSARRLTGLEICPPRSPDPCSSDPSGLSPCSAGACSPPCSGRKGCCPPAGCRPVRRRTIRCNAPCTGDSQSCGGGGCCGGGCRGGCGKPGQICLPLRPCTTPPCKLQPRAGGSPCMPPRRCPPQPPCCRSPVMPGTPGSATGSPGGGGGSSCCRSRSPGGRSAGGGRCSANQGCQQPDGIDPCCQPKVPTGCECLGGGQDCQRCGRKVYQAEMQIASGVPYHNICFSCFCCRKPLETLTYHENCGEIYCKQCYVRNFGPQGYGYAGVLQTPM